MAEARVRPEIPALNNEYKLYIDTTPEDDTATMAQVSKGFDNISEALNEVLYQASFIGDGGYGSTYVTGGQLTVTLPGVRVIGDKAQDYMFGDAVYFNWGKARMTSVELTTPDGWLIKCPVTLAKINRTGGAGNGVTAVSVDMHFNGKPTVTKAPVPAPTE